MWLQGDAESRCRGQAQWLHLMVEPAALAVPQKMTSRRGVGCPVMPPVALQRCGLHAWDSKKAT